MKYELQSTKQYKKWFIGIKDRQTRNRILRRIDSMIIGYFGDHKQIITDLFELRMCFGPGFRVYYTVQGEFIFLLIGGDKSTQKKDIAKAIKLLKQLKEV